MSHESTAPLPDLIRWSFTIDPVHRAEIETHLDDQGADVLVRDESQFVVTWEEPERDLDEVVEAIWAINGEPFEVTQEEFQRVGMHALESVEDESAQGAA